MLPLGANHFLKFWPLQRASNGACLPVLISIPQIATKVNTFLHASYRFRIQHTSQKIRPVNLETCHNLSRLTVTLNRLSKLISLIKTCIITFIRLFYINQQDSNLQKEKWKGSRTDKTSLK